MTPKPKSFARLAFIALMAALQLLAPIGDTHAAKFDEKLKAPEAPTNEALKVAIREYFDVYARATAESPAGMVRDKAAHSKWYDTQWLVQRAIDTKRDLGDLSQFGITPNPLAEYSYSIDLAKYPQWSPLNTSMLRLLEPVLVDAYTPDLKARGFRDQDIDIIKAYAAKNRPDRAAYPEKLSLSESFASKVQQRLARKEKFEAPQMLVYLYQNSRIQAEAERAWTESLLDSLDQQRQRILESYFAEQISQTSMAIGPDDIEAATVWTRHSIVSGEYSRLLEAEKAQVRDMEVHQ